MGRRLQALHCAVRVDQAAQALVRLVEARRLHVPEHQRMGLAEEDQCGVSTSNVDWDAEGSWKEA